MSSTMQNLMAIILIFSVIWGYIYWDVKTTFLMPSQSKDPIAKAAGHKVLIIMWVVLTASMVYVLGVCFHWLPTLNIKFPF